MRYLIKFSKESHIKFISHLDLMRTIQRTLRRADMPMEYSKGFNPHMSLSLAQPLSVGMYSEGEYMDFNLVEEVDKEEIIKRINNSAPSGIKALKAVKIREESNKKVFKSMAAVEGAKYKLEIKYETLEKLKEEMELLLNKSQWNIIRKSKSGEKEVNIKELIYQFEYLIEKDKLIIEATVACGSRENLSAELLSEFIRENTSNVKENSFVDIKRIEMYGKNPEEKLVPLYEYVENFI